MTDSPDSPDPLAPWYRRHDARLADYRGVRSPASYGAEDATTAEAAALAAGCGLVLRPWRARLEMTGEDRLRFLNGLVTCEVKTLEPGRGTYGFVTSVKGRVLADLTVLAADDRLALDLPVGAAATVAEHLAKYAIVDRVEIARRDDRVHAALVGPGVDAVLEPGTAPPAEVDDHRRIALAGVEIDVVREPPLGKVPVLSLVLPAADAERLLSSLVERGATPVGHRALDGVRVLAGRPVFGVDFDDGNFPQETGLEERAVSYTKGCYLGQEIVARIHYRGGVNRHLRGLVLDPGSPVEELAGRSILAEDRAAGTLTSVAELDERRLGLAIVHHRVEPGSRVALAGGGGARLVELPFAPQIIGTSPTHRSER